MTQLGLISALIWLGTSMGLNPLFAQADFQLPTHPRIKSVSHFELPADPLQVVLHLAYAQSRLQNPEAWPQIPATWVTRVQVVYTHYPEDFERWRTDHDELLTARLRALYQLDSSIFAQTHIQWEYILQTGCKVESEAQAFFHGLVITYEPQRLPPPAVDSLIVKHPGLKPLANIVYGRVEKLPDSSAYYILERHPEWKNMLVVMDWTSSMYVNRASVLNWHRKQLGKGKIQHLILFNDGNWTPHGLKKLGRTGGIYHIRPDSLPEVLALMAKVKENGLGGDPAENDIEALLKATRSFDDFDEVILLPDRFTSVRDIRLVTRLRHPVRILVFGGKKSTRVGLGQTGEVYIDQFLHPHYLSLASMTGGSLHTKEGDYYQLPGMKAGERIRIGTYQFEKQANGSFVVVR